MRRIAAKKLRVANGPVMNARNSHLTLDNLKAVFFDCGGTLVSLVPPREELFIRAANSIGLRLSPQAVKQAYRIVDFHTKYSSISIAGPNDRDSFYKRYNQQLCCALGLSSQFAALYPRVVDQFRESKSWKLLPDTYATLKALFETGIPLAIVANWDKSLPAFIENLGIAAFFRIIVSSAEIGVEKPAPTIFRAALDHLLLVPERDDILYVGNEYETDVISARAAGLLPVLIDRDGDYPHADCLRFDSLAQCFDSLDIHTP